MRTSRKKVALIRNSRVLGVKKTGLGEVSKNKVRVTGLETLNKLKMILTRNSLILGDKTSFNKKDLGVPIRNRISIKIIGLENLNKVKKILIQISIVLENKISISRIDRGMPIENKIHAKTLGLGISINVKKTLIHDSKNSEDKTTFNKISLEKISGTRIRITNIGPATSITKKKTLTRSSTILENKSSFNNKIDQEELMINNISVIILGLGTRMKTALKRSSMVLEDKISLDKMDIGKNSKTKNNAKILDLGISIRLLKMTIDKGHGDITVQGCKCSERMIVGDLPITNIRSLEISKFQEKSTKNKI